MARLTAVFIPGQGMGPLLPPEAEGLPTCAAALANAPKLQGDTIIQVSRCIIDAPTQAENIRTQDAQRLYATCRLRDWSGAVDVDVVHEAMPFLYGHSDPSEVRKALEEGTLTPTLTRLNARGIIRTTEAGVTKIFISKITDSPLDVEVSAQAMKASLGLSEITGDVVMAALAERLQDAPLVGLALRSDHVGFVSAHRVLLLVQGSCKSELEPLGDGSQSLTAVLSRFFEECEILVKRF